MHSTLYHKNAGGIDERGFLRGLHRKGFTFPKCLSEGHANSIDGHATHIMYKVLRDMIKIIDNGCGMTEQQLMNAFLMYGENHSTDMSIGVSGLGMKAMLFIIGKSTVTITITKTEDGPYLTAIAPWDIMYEQGRINNMIDIRESTEEEIVEFNEDRSYLSNPTGTTHKFKYNHELAYTIAEQFVEPNISSIIPEDRLSNIYGRFLHTSTYSHFEMTSPKTLPLYNYFHADKHEFYGGIQVERIDFMEDSKGDKRYIWNSDDGPYEITHKGRGFSVTPEPVKTNLIGYTCYGEAVVTTGTRRNINYFDDDKPMIPTSSNILHPHDELHIGKYEEFLAKVPIIRNNQFIGTMDIPDFKASSSRGNGETMHKIYLNHCELSYNPLSRNDNKQDLVIGVQECKGQYISTIPLNLSRLIKAIKFEKAKKEWTYFEDKYKSQLPHVVPMVEEVTPPIQ